MSTQDLSIIIRAVVNPDDKQQQDLLQNQLNTLASKLKLNVAIDTNSINNLSKQIGDLQRSLTAQGKGIKIIDEEQLKDKTLFKTLDDAVSKYKELGQVKITQNFDEATNKLKSFIIELTKANGIVENMKFSAVNVAGGNEINSSYLLETTKIIDQTQKQQEQALQKTQQINQKIASDKQKEVDDEQKKRQSYIDWWTKQAVSMDQKERESSQKNAQAYVDFWEKALKERELAEDKLAQKEQSNNQKRLQNINEQRKALREQYTGLQNDPLLKSGAQSQLQSFTGLINSATDDSGLDKAKQQLNNLLAIQKELNSQVKQESQERLNAYNATVKQANEQKAIADYLNIQRAKADTKVTRTNTRYGSSPETTQASETLMSTFDMSAEGKSLKDVKNAVDLANSAFDKHVATLKNVNKEVYDITQMLEVATKKVLVWATSTTLVYGSLHFLQDGAHFVADLNKELTLISTTVNYSQPQVLKLGEAYNKLAEQMGVTTKDVASGAVEFFRQGLGGKDEEVQNRLKTSIEYAKISGLEYKQSAEILTAASNTMKIPIEKAADVFTLLGDSAATSANEIGRAFQKVG